MKPLLGRTVVFALVVAVTGGTAAPKPKEVKAADIKQFEGEWALAFWGADGPVFPADLGDAAKWSVKGDKYRYESGGGTIEEGTIKLHPDQKPAAIDLAITEGTDKGKDQVGIYRIDKDEIVICLARAGEKERPTTFDGAREKGHLVVTIKRVKKGD